MRDQVSGGPLLGFDAELQEFVPQLLEAYGVPGAAVGVIHKGETWMTKGFGSANRELQQPVTNRTAFNIGSISKTVAAWGVMRLVESGEIDLNAPVSEYLTRWELPPSEFDHDAVTVRRLLSHTAGLSLHGYPGFHPSEPLPTVEESLSGATNGPGGVFVAHAPASRWQYSGGGYTLAQLIIEEVTGVPFGEYMKSTVLEPLGMTSSSYVWDESIDQIVAAPYGSAGERIDGQRFTAMAAAGLQTTLDDFTRFALASVASLDGSGGTGGVLSVETLQLMHTPVEPSDDYGIGYSVNDLGGVRLVGHGGANAGWMARLQVDPASGDGIVIMTNGSNGGAVHGAISCLWRLWRFGTGCDAPPELPVRIPVETLRTYQGEYQLPDGPIVTLTVEHGLLIWRQSDHESAAVADKDGEFRLIRAPVRFTFETNDAGQVSAMLVRMAGDEEVRAPKRIGS